MSSSAVSQRRIVYYSGRVQGVGFRYTTKRIAAGFAVTGFVRNLADGRVEMVAEGSPTELDALMRDIREHFGSHIGNELCDKVAANGEYRTFDIRY